MGILTGKRSMTYLYEQVLTSNSLTFRFVACIDIVITIRDEEYNWIITEYIIFLLFPFVGVVVGGRRVAWMVLVDNHARDSHKRGLR